MHRISRELIDRILDDPNAVEAIGGIGQYILPRDAKALDLGLSRPELNFYMFQTYDAEVCRNGHLWFFLNPSGDDTRRILSALEEIELTTPREILLEACSVFPEGMVPDSQEDRAHLLKTLSYAETIALWDRLDTAYFGDWKRNLSYYDRVMEYLRKHRAEILTVETA